MWFHEHLDHGYSVDQLAKSASRALGALVTKYHQTGGMDFAVFTKLYQSLVLPVLLYGSGVWGHNKYKCVNAVQLRASKIFLGLGKRAPNCSAVGDIGWSSCYSRQLGEVYRMMLRFTDMNNTRLNKRVYLWSKDQSKSNEAKFTRTLRNMNIDCMSFSGNPRQAVKDLIKAVDEYEQSVWYYQIWNDKGNEINGNKLRLYRLFKERIDVESYVTQPLLKEYRKAIAKLRSGTMALYVETGRYNRTPLADRICTYCESGKVEDEQHFLLSCDLYNDLRYELLQSMCGCDPDFMYLERLAQFCLIMSRPSIQPLLGKTLCRMYKRRKAFTV